MKAAIFDLDGVLVDTAVLHYLAWREIAAKVGFDLTPEFNERLKGVSREGSLEIVLQAAGLDIAPEERRRLADEKNARYVELVSGLRPADLLPGARHVLEELRARSIRLAVGSASRNAPAVIDRLGISSLLDTIVGGDDLAHPKPHPEVFLLAAAQLGIEPRECVVFEDAEVGLQAARTGGMVAIGIGLPENLPSAELVLENLAALDIDALFPLNEEVRA